MLRSVRVLVVRAVCRCGAVHAVAIAATTSPIAVFQLAAQSAADSMPPGHTVRAPVSVGNYPNVTGLRLNFRDHNLEQVRGVNVTVWFPHKPSSGAVRGVALGVPVTGARIIHGISAAALGVTAERELRGIAVGGIGVGTGRSFKGIALGGLGVGGSGPMSGIMVGGIGAASAGGVHGLMLGGIGAATGGDMHGVVMGGLGAGIARDLKGIAVGGLGVGVAGHVSGIMVGGIGAAVGGNVTGIALSGVGTAAGGTFKGIGLSGVAVTAGILRGGFAAPYIATANSRGVVVAPVLFKVQPDGTVQGISVSALNAVRGYQHGVAIGIVNYARSLRGAQIGLLNIVANGGAHRILPIFNWGTSKAK